jgi:hypothetical protein
MASIHMHPSVTDQDPSVTDYLTTAVMQKVSLEATSCSDSKEITHILQNQKVHHYSIPNGPNPETHESIHNPSTMYIKDPL